MQAHVASCEKAEQCAQYSVLLLSLRYMSPDTITNCYSDILAESGASGALP